MRLILLLSLLLFPALAAAEPTAVVTRLVGQASAGAEELRPGATIETGTPLATAIGARMELRFADGTQVVLGEQARLTVERFSWHPAEGRGEALLRSDAGAFLVTTGAIAKLPDRPLRVATPVASIGVRGTRFWGGKLDHALDVVVLDGVIFVENQTGRVELDRPQAGTDVAAPDSAPRPPSTWAADRLARALATIAFD